jgi:hypothetical protein
MSDWTAVRIDDLEAIRWPGAETTWRPLRQAIGARIVGMGTYTAEEPGQDVVEPHRETEGGMGHEEVYVVLRGRATFTLDGETLGGEPTYRPSSSEWIERARPQIRSDPERARAIVDDLRAQRPDAPGLPIAEALLAVGRGDEAAARGALARVAPEYRERLRSDPDLGSFVP